MVRGRFSDLPTDVCQTVQGEVLCYCSKVDCFFAFCVLVDVIDEIEDTGVDLAFESWYFLCCILVVLVACHDHTGHSLQA